MKKIIFILLSTAVISFAEHTKQNPGEKKTDPLKSENQEYDCSKSKSLACKPKNIKKELDTKVKTEEEKYDKALKDLE